MGNVERDEMIRRLHAQGESYRAIGERVGLSAMQCQRIDRRAVEPVTADDDDDEVYRRYMAELVAEVFSEDGRLNKDSRLYKLVFVVVPERRLERIDFG